MHSRKEWFYNESTKPLSDQVNRHATSEHNQLYFHQEMVPHLGLECQCCLRQSDLICVKSRGSCGGREGGEAAAFKTKQFVI